VLDEDLYRSPKIAKFILSILCKIPLTLQKWNNKWKDKWDKLTEYLNHILLETIVWLGTRSLEYYVLVSYFASVSKLSK
jgi:hypothetical protein